MRQQLIKPVYFLHSNKISAKSHVVMLKSRNDKENPVVVVVVVVVVGK